MRVRLAIAVTVLGAGGCFSPDAQPENGDTDPASSGTGATTGQTSGLVTSVSASGATSPSTGDVTAGPTTGPTTTDSGPVTSSSGPASESGTDTDATGEPVLPECGDGVPVATEFCFEGAPLIYAVGGNPVDVAIGDLTDNAVLDIVSLNRDAANPSITVLEADGVGGYVTGDTPGTTDPGSRIRVADVDGDLDNDIVFLTGSGARYFRNSGQFFSSSEVASAFGGDWFVAEMVVADLNGDDVFDVALTEGYAQVWFAGQLSMGGVWSLSDNSTNFPIPGEGSAGFTVGPLSFNAGDGLDVVSFNQYDDTARILTNDGAGVFSDAGQTTLCPENVGIRFGEQADLDGDGNTDLVVTCMDGDAVIALDDGTGAFASSSALVLAGAWRPVVADLDGDGDVDILVSSTTLNRAVVFLNDGSGGFELSDTQFTASGPVYGAAVADLNDDGALDVVVAAFADAGEVQVHLAAP